MLNLFMMRKFMIISCMLNIIILLSCDGYTPKMRNGGSVPVDDGTSIKNGRTLSRKKWSDIRKKFGLKANIRPKLVKISDQNTIDCDGRQLSVDIKNLKPFGVYANDAHCARDGVVKPCNVRRTSTYTGFTSDGQRYIVTFDKNFNVRSVDCGCSHMESVFPRLMARIDVDDTVESKDHDELFQDNDERTPNHERNLRGTLMKSDEDDTNIIATKEGDIRRNSRSLISEGDVCLTFEQTRVAIGFDTTFCNAEGGYDNAVVEVQNIVARASMAYESQGVCVMVVVSHIDGHCDESTDPYRDGLLTDDIGCYGNDGLMQHFKAITRSEPYFADADASHLFYHQRLMNTRSTRGCANFNRMCNRAYGVNDMSFNGDEERRGYLFAHELGHNFGMNHHPNFKDKKSIMKGVPGSGPHYWHPNDLDDFAIVLARTFLRNCLPDVPNPDLFEPTPFTKSPTKTPTQSPTKSPTKSPLKAPTKSPTASPVSPTLPPGSSPSPSSCLIFETETFENGWSNGKNEILEPYGKILGRWYGKGENVGYVGSAKRFSLSNLIFNPDEVVIKFTLFEFDRWEGDERALVKINGKIINLGNDLGKFANNDKTPLEVSRDGNVKGILWSLVPDLNKTFITGGGHQKQKDQRHFVTITVPKDVYINLGYIDLEFSFFFNQNERNESAGITDLVMEACIY